ncbi:MAG TPA: CBS domain-containing protein [Candidatus Omnitrophota bacterium]|nr:CBS domain-containing protein [Candidatus Omnitrophota bacterium]HPT38860.1 CBS domain-containing protein [Candidatus Omnitrophota bacterium]
MNYLPKKFIFLYYIIGLPVIDSLTGKKIGRIKDLVASLKEMYPRITGLIMRNKKNKDIYLPWGSVKMMVEEKGIFIENYLAVAQEQFVPAENELLLKEIFWDKQIVDIHGSKVVRINDLHLLREGLSLWVVHVDIGITGLLRRLGCSKIFEFMIKLVSSYEVEDRIISWKYVQPINGPIGSDALSLKVHHSKLSELHPADIADILIDLGTEERLNILKSMDKATAARTIQELPIKIRLQVAELLDQKLLIEIINEMPMDEAVDLFSEMPIKKMNALFTRLPAEKVAQISSLLGHANDIAGSIMSTEFICIRQAMTAAEALEKTKKESTRKKESYYIYVLDDNDALAGVVTLQQLLTTSGEKIVSDFMRKRVAKVKIKTKIKDVAEVFYKYDFTVVPVIDKAGKIQGIITMKDAFEAVFHQIRKETEQVQ